MSPRPTMMVMVTFIALAMSSAPATAQSAGQPPTSQEPTGAGEVETVQPFDTLDITVLQLDSLNRTVEVNSVGVITLPLAGDFNVVGKTTKQVAADIAERLGRHDLQNPEVTVTLKDASQQTVSLRDSARRGFTVEGEVTQPGVYSIYGPTTLLQGIAMAKGIDQYANEKHVTVFRDAAGRAAGQTYNLNDIRDGKIADPAIYPRDTIVVATSKTRRFVSLADAPLLATAAAGTIIVIEAGETGHQMALTALKRVESGGARVLGVVLTKFSHSAGLGGDYGYAYNYGAKGERPPGLRLIGKNVGKLFRRI